MRRQRFHDLRDAAGPRGIARAAAVWLLALLLLAGAAHARTLVIANFEASLRVETDGAIVVTETIHPRFEGKWNGIYRTIPIEYRTPQGFNKTFFLEILSITDDAGNSLKYEASNERHYRKLKIWVPGAEDATRTVKIIYRVPNALLFFEDHDELYWNVTGDEWEVPIEKATADVELPAGAAGVRTLVFTGAYGSRERDADIREDGHHISFAMRRPLSFREGMTIVIGWNKGLVQEPSKAQGAWLFLRSNWPLFVPIVAFIAMWRLWYTRGRDPKLRPISVQYQPPEGLTPGEVGTLIDSSPDMRDITATLVDLAVRGYILIEETKEDHMMGLWTSKDYAFHKRKAPDTRLKAHESGLMNALFSSGDVVSMSSLENRFYTYLPGIKDRMFEALMQRRYYSSRPDRVKARWVVGGALVGFFSIWGGAFLANFLGMQGQPFIIAGILSGAIIAFFGYFMPARTMEGTRALEGILGFEEFLGRVEEPRFNVVIKTPQMFEKFLPYAMALGVEKRWVAAFDDIMKQPPDWYRGDSLSGFRASSFVNNMGRMSTAAASAMASAPRSSGDSGFGGGGSSGGGGGGGGGGGF